MKQALVLDTVFSRARIHGKCKTIYSMKTMNSHWFSFSLKVKFQGHFILLRCWQWYRKQSSGRWHWLCVCVIGAAVMSVDDDSGQKHRPWKQAFSVTKVSPHFSPFPPGGFICYSTPRDVRNGVKSAVICTRSIVPKTCLLLDFFPLLSCGMEHVTTKSFHLHPQGLCWSSDHLVIASALLPL